MNFGDYLEHCINVLKAENRYGYARNLDELRASILHFRKTLDFYFSDIDLRWLRGYELYLRSRGIAGDIQHSRHTEDSGSDRPCQVIRGQEAEHTHGGTADILHHDTLREESDI